MASIKTYEKMIAQASVNNQLPNSSHAATDKLVGSCVLSGRFTGGYGYECGDRSRLLVVLRWCSGILQKIVDAYLSSPIFMAVVPLLIGLGLGIFLALNIGQRNKHSEVSSMRDTVNKKGRELSIISLGIYHVYNIFSLVGLIPDHSEGNNEELMGPKIEGQFNSVTEKEDVNKDENEDERDCITREYLKSNVHTQRESGLELSEVPKHIAVIMDGNRRYGRAKYGSVTKGHWDGSKTLVDFSKWCLAEGVEVVTVYAFSTENWNRSASEVSVLMGIFCKYCDELRVEALERGIRLKVLSTETDKIPPDVAQGIQRMVEETKQGKNLTMNICLSYGSKGEILNACKAIAHDVKEGLINPSEITNSTFENKLLTGGCSDPDLIIRTSGEFRLSNFLLWQLAYAEMFFLDKQWPELTKGDLITVIQEYAKSRQRRFGK